VGGIEHPAEDGRRNRLTGELCPDVAPAEDRLVEADHRHRPFGVDGPVDQACALTAHGPAL
jgi:hypothetical protein